MRLLHTDTLQLESFDSDIPPYAILSHTWGKDEVTFQEMMVANRSAATKRKAGWQKIFGACRYARKYDFKWIWIDTCCINKESSAELSEALNSMYAYYEDAQVCYVYLEDAKHDNFNFNKCRWFTRGWTLQELLAPSYVVFLDQCWEVIGTRYSLADVVSATTSIPVSVFRDGDLDKFGVAQKMSWAAPRQTSRPEDMAYCLLGIFRVSMSPIYGEGGARAFMRLQQEIINISDDRSIFAWVAPHGENEPRGLLARSPAEFRWSSEVQASEADDIGDTSFSFGNNGLRIHLPLVPVEPVSAVVSETAKTQRSANLLRRWSRVSAVDTEPSYPVGTIFSAPLHCCSERNLETGFAVYLQKVAGERYVRCRPEELAIIPAASRQPDICQVVVKENPGISRKVKNDHNATRLSIRNTTPGVFLSRDGHLENNLSTVPDPDKDKEVQGMKETLVNIKYWPDVNMGRGTWPVAHLKYRCLKYEFLVELGFKCDVGSLRFAMRPYSTPASLWNDNDDPCRDWMIMKHPLMGAGFVSVAYHMTGDETVRILEVRYVGPDKAKLLPISRALLQPQEEKKEKEEKEEKPFRLGFMVPSMIREKVESNFFGRTHEPKVFHLTDVFPSDFFGKEYTGQTYVDMSALEERAQFRVLTYTAPSNTNPKDTTPTCVYVVIGFHKSKAWMDIVVSTDSPKLLWESYCDKGSRAPTRIQCSPDATPLVLTAEITRSLKRPNFTGNVKERNSLQLGSHVLSVNYFMTPQ
ncbi:hypothetical protein D9758_013437 [Tetrapyrgos nigripes]|uniref:Heterokaryon incompatibility domain-containing protein n=1 Tax=Tetrapyrgos nigripes TaxID=182062 RepID=A0A8H5CM98_9AGAR|nr:hypothetical protein D9758_013437 [Tetrapyrgos nigripes]